MSAGSKLIWPIIAGAGGFAAAFVAKTTVRSSWRFVTGEDPPGRPEDPDTPWLRAFSWSLASMAVIEAGRLGVTRQAARYWRDRTGTLPPLPSDKKHPREQA